jgi:hypothetical protein
MKPKGLIDAARDIRRRARYQRRARGRGKAAPRDVYGTSRLECIFAGRWTRGVFGGVRWQDADANAILTETATELVMNVKRGQVIAIDPAGEPGIARILSGIENEDLSGG